MNSPYTFLSISFIFYIYLKTVDFFLSIVAIIWTSNRPRVKRKWKEFNYSFKPEILALILRISQKVYFHLQIIWGAFIFKYIQKDNFSLYCDALDMSALFTLSTLFGLILTLIVKENQQKFRENTLFTKMHRNVLKEIFFVHSNPEVICTLKYKQCLYDQIQLYIVRTSPDICTIN